MRTNKLTGAALDWAVAKCEGWPVDIWFDEDQLPMVRDDEVPEYKPSSNWAQGGPIIEREGIALYLYGDGEWNAHTGGREFNGPTPLIAAMRCYVASKLGDEVDVPEVVCDE